jgi:hypothetical protein
MVWGCLSLLFAREAGNPHLTISSTKTIFDISVFNHLSLSGELNEQRKKKTA